jgi:hypothetical protein
MEMEEMRGMKKVLNFKCLIEEKSFCHIGNFFTLRLSSLIFLCPLWGLGGLLL